MVKLVDYQSFSDGLSALSDQQITMTLASQPDKRRFWPIVVKLSRERSVGRSVGLSVCPVHCGKTADCIRQPFGIVGRTRPGMRQVVGFGDRSTGRDTFVGEFGARHCNQLGLYGVRVRHRRDVALFPNYFGQTCLQKWQNLGR